MKFEKRTGGSEYWCLEGAAEGVNSRFRRGNRERRCRAILFFLVFLLWGGQSAFATYGPPVREPVESRVERTVLALYDGSDETSADETRIHKYLELPLNHLGYTVVYWDVSGGLPTPGEVGARQRVVTWFSAPIARSRAYLAWAETAAKSGTRFAVLGDPGIAAEADPEGSLAGLNAFLGHLGLRVTDRVAVTYKTRVRHEDPSMVGFERSLDPVLPPYPVVELLDERVVSHLSLRRDDGTRARDSAIVTTGPGGGYVPEGFAMSAEPGIDRVKWLVNPFAFFKAAFGGRLRPVPDVTTLSGRRLYFSHIDGDGWNNRSEIEDYRRTESIAAEVVLWELIAPYPDMPVSVGLIAGDVDPELGAFRDSRKIARQLFELPQVEVAAHTYSHPYDWTFFEDYVREEELGLLQQVARETRPKPYQKLFSTVAATFGLTRFLKDIDNWTSGSDALPRTYMKRPFDLEREIIGALDVANSLAPEGKSAALYQWSGNTDPFPAAIEMTREADVRNINGGDSRFDGEFPSVAYVPPIARPVGEERQIYAVNSNENTYTRDWSGPYYAQRFLEETLRNTETPRRLKGVNVYYHMYTGEKPASLSAVRSQIEHARTAPLIPVRTSEYAAIADSFFEVEIAERTPRVWAVRNRGTLNTVRFDEAAELTVDAAQSAGVLGHNRHGDSLYVALDPAVSEAIVALMETREQSGGDSLPELVESRWQFSDLVRETCGFSVTATGYGDGEMTWRGLRNARYEITASRAGRVLWQDEIPARDERLEVTIEADAIEPVELEFECPEKAPAAQ